MTTVISDVGRALRALLRPQLPAAAAISLAAPPATSAEPAVHLVLSWLRDDPNGRQSGAEDVRAADGSVLGRRGPARRYELRYLVTARAATVEDEHELLDAVLFAVSGLDALPAECLPKSLADCGLPVRIEVCTERGGGDPPTHAGFGLLVSAPLLPPLQTDLAPPAAELTIGVKRVPAVMPPGRPVPNGSGKQWRRSRVEED